MVNKSTKQEIVGELPNSLKQDRFQEFWRRSKNNRPIKSGSWPFSPVRALRSRNTTDKSIFFAVVKCFL